MSFILHLKKLKAFNPAIIYCLDPEMSMQGYDSSSAEHFLHGVGQYEDIFDAYLYAQETILPTIEKEGIAHITPEQIAEWLNQLHFRIAGTLARDIKTNAGELAKLQIFRWNPNNSVQTLLYCYLLGKFNTKESIKEFTSSNVLDEDTLKQAMEIMANNSSLNYELPKAFILAVLEAMKINKDDAIKLLELFERCHKDEAIEIPEDQKSIINLEAEEIRPVIITATKFAVLYHNNKLTPDEKSAVEKVVKICISPSQYPEAMKKFTEDFIKAWRSCDKNNLDQVARLATNIFFNITEIHWYFNGNGRLATCFMNTILCSLGRPSILMRYTDERRNPNSSYSKAINSININADLLFEHIKSRIKQTEENGAYSNKSLLIIVNARINLGITICEIMELFPEYDINATLSEGIDKISKSNDLKKRDNDEINVYTLELISSLDKFLNSKFTELKEQQKFSGNKLTIVPEVVQRKYSPKEVKIIIQKLETLTNETGWISYKNGTIILLNMEEDEVAKKLVKTLGATDALNAAFKTNTKTNNPVVYLDSIHFEKLILIKSLDGIEPIKNSKLELIKPPAR